MSASISGIGAIIIGDEITLGRRADKHFPKLVEILSARGLTLDWALYMGDNRQRLTEALTRTMASEDIVFSFGGIGNTPDDHTRQAAAAASGVELALHPEAEREIRARFAELKLELTDLQLGLGNFPLGSRIIPNPFNRIPGFSLGQHHFVPGFPQMAWPMVEWVLDSYYRDRFHAHPSAEAAILVWKGVEGALINLMRRIEADYPAVKVFSLPFLGSTDVRRHIELGVRGAPEQVPAAMEEIRRGVVELGYTFDEK